MAAAAIGAMVISGLCSVPGHAFAPAASVMAIINGKLASSESRSS